MAANGKFCLQLPQRDSYLELVKAFPLASIRSESGEGKLDEGEKLYLDALSDMTAAYEDEHHAIEPASDADMLRQLMSAKAASQAEIHQATGIPKSTISEVLAGKKPFSRHMIRKLAAYFGVDVAILAGNI